MFLFAQNCVHSTLNLNTLFMHSSLYETNFAALFAGEFCLIFNYAYKEISKYLVDTFYYNMPCYVSVSNFN